MTETPETQAPEDAGQAAEKGKVQEQKQWFNYFEGEDLGYLQNKGWDKENGFQDMFKSYRNLEKMRGVSEDRLLTIPDGDDPDGWEKVYNKLGKPENPNDYSFQAPEGVELDEGRMEWFNSLAHKLNLNKQQHNEFVKNALEYENGLISEMNEAANQDRLLQLDELKKAWGNKYNERVELGARAIRSFGLSEDSINALEEAIGSNAEVIKLFATIGERLKEGDLPSNDGEGQFGKTREQYANDITSLKNEIKGDPVRLAEFNKGRGSDYEKLNKLRRLANG